MAELWDDAESDWDDLDDDDLDEDDETSVVTCPSCGAEVYEEADVCSHCGDFLVGAAGRRSGRSVGTGWWRIVIIGWLIVALAGLLSWLR